MLSFILSRDGVFSKELVLLPKEAFVLRSFNNPLREKLPEEYYLNIKLDAAEGEMTADHFFSSKFSEF